MNSVTYLTRATIGASAAFGLGLLFNVAAGPLFLIAVSAFMSLTLARDYARPVRRWQPRVAVKRAPHRLPLAA